MSDQAEPEFVEVPSRTMNGLYDRIRDLEAELVEAREKAEKHEDALHAFKGVVDVYSWLGEGRGPYTWDDARYDDDVRAFVGALQLVLPVTGWVGIETQTRRAVFAEQEREALAAQNRELREALEKVAWSWSADDGLCWCEPLGNDDPAAEHWAQCKKARSLLAAQPTPGAERAPQEVRLVFDASPGPESCRFIETELPDGRSVRVGEWHERQDGSGQWELRILAVLPDRVTEEQ